MESPVTHQEKDSRYAPRYSYAEADYLAQVSRGTSKRWIAGYSYRGGSGRPVRQPPVTRVTGNDEAVSFVDLVEIAAIGRLRGLGFTLSETRMVVRNCQEILEVERPLTTLRLKTGGREIFVDRGSILVVVGRRRGQQAWNEVLDPFLRELDYGQNVVSRWWPLGKDRAVVVDPDYAYGLPAIAKSGVRTEIILERFQAGDLEAQIAQDFNIGREEVERALQFELKRAA